MKSILKTLHNLLLKPAKKSNFVITVFFMLSAILISYMFMLFISKNSANISLIYLLTLVLIARFTSGYMPGIIASILSIFCINYLFTYPYFELNFTLTGYPITFICMLAVSIITSTTTTHLKKQLIISSGREKLLMEAEKEKMRANLLRAVSHDLRTPLTSIIGNCSIYIDNGCRLSESDKLELVNNIYNDSNWLLNMVENLLSVTRIRNDSTHVTKSMEPVEEIVSSAVIRIKKRLPNANIHVRVPDEFLMIPMDAVLIQQVIINLLENAIVHSNTTKPIDFYVNSDADSVGFYIKDYGIGIPETKLNTIFDGSSYHPEHSTDTHKGMGIGLSICKTIIVAHHGTISARNHEDGAEFYFILPKEDSHN